MNKQELRETVRARRGQAAEADLARDGEIIFRKVRECSDYYLTHAIYAYIDMKKEVPTRTFIAQAWVDGKRVAVPRVDEDGMHFYYIDSFRQIEEGPDGIPVPKADAERANAESALMIVPGVAFDPTCARVGYGKGCYDSYLREHPAHRTIGVAFDFQVFPEVPQEADDVRVQWLFTESRRYKRP